MWRHLRERVAQLAVKVVREGGERRKCKEMEERAVDQRPLARRWTRASNNAGEERSNDWRRAAI